MPRFATILLLLLAATAAATVGAQAPRTDDYGGLASYPVPAVRGGPAEFRYCVVYAKRAWRVGGMVAEGKISLGQAKRWAGERLGKNAAMVEIADYDQLERGGFKTHHQMAAARFIRCANALKLNPQMQHGGNAEHCFRMIGALDIVARARAEGRPEEQARQELRTHRPDIKDETVESVVKLAFSGKTINEGSGVIEDAFSECFSRAGGR
ncbi:hypothetical protein FN976_18585 [Caenimonas sedimenti]|uniref:Uncharacterized protein n=1 Tax=Caenimonas sedimenti TaxID=2596921 RepID=A0A562ZNU6_9BURK|nr:hypothetical protein [Caenimonas sedimenti]TWO69824.1 hypothetical protein FN976_18585 [Caenimonas sedimenti]